MYLKFKSRGAEVCRCIDISQIVYTEKDSRLLIITKDDEEIANIVHSTKAKEFYQIICTGLKNKQEFFDLTGLEEG